MSGHRYRSQPSARWPSGSLWAAALPIAGVTACFTGADAQGLPCRSVLDCGQGQSCREGYCGGPPATTGAGSSTTTAVISNDGSSGSSTGATPMCGDGAVDPELGEACDPGTGVDGPGCNADCTRAVCGDGYTNDAAGERCDDGNDSNLDECTNDCTRTLFWDDMSRGPLDTMKWTRRNRIHAFMGEDYGLSEVDFGWQWNVPPGMWSSGLYSSVEGTSGILSAPIEFPPGPGPGFRFELRFRHRYRFDGNPVDVDADSSACQESPQNPNNETYDDGAIVWIVEGGEVVQPAAPIPGSTGARPLDNNSECGVEGSTSFPNPLSGGPMPSAAFTGRVDDLTDVRFPLPPDIGGRTVQLLFEVGYDCFNCWGGSAPMGAGWTIDDVVVAPFPM